MLNAVWKDCIPSLGGKIHRVQEHRGIDEGMPEGTMWSGVEVCKGQAREMQVETVL